MEYVNGGEVRVCLHLFVCMSVFSVLLSVSVVMVSLVSASNNIVILLFIPLFYAKLCDLNDYCIIIISSSSSPFYSLLFCYLIINLCFGLGLT